MIVARIWEGAVIQALRNGDLAAIYFSHGDGPNDWYSGAHGRGNIGNRRSNYPSETEIEENCINTRNNIKAAIT